MATTPLVLLGFGFLLGIRHSLDIDHLAAVSTFVTRRRTVWGGAVVGVLWGLGHTAALLVVAAGVIALRAEIPPTLARGLELCVAAMLIGLGLSLLATLLRGGRVHLHAHQHGGRVHVHPHVHDAQQVETGGTHHRTRSNRGTFLVGVVHGLAGSAGVMLAVLATIPAPTLALGYVALFGCGSICGMVVMSTLLGAPLVLVAGRFSHAEGALRACAAVASVAVGLVLAWQVGWGE